MNIAAQLRFIVNSQETATIFTLRILINMLNGYIQREFIGVTIQIHWLLCIVDMLFTTKMKAYLEPIN